MSLTKWFNERWVDLGRLKKGGGYEDCGRSDASKGAYPKCVPAARAASMTSSQVRSALRRKREAERDTRRVGKRPIMVATSANTTRTAAKKASRKLKGMQGEPRDEK